MATNGGFFSDHNWTKEDFDKIRQVLQLDQLPDATRRSLLNAGSLYGSTELSPMPRQGESKKNLSAFSRAVNQLIQALKNLDELSAQCIVTAQFNEKHIEKVYDLLETLPNDLSMLSDATTLALNDMEKLRPDKGGPKFANSLRVTIEALASIYENSTGKKPTMPSKCDNRIGGRFFLFVTTFLSIIGARVQSDQSVGELIKKVLRQRSKENQAFTEVMPISTIPNQD